MCAREHSRGLPIPAELALLAGAKAAPAAVELQGQLGAVLVEPVIQRDASPTIAAVGRGGVEKVYGVPY